MKSLFTATKNYGTACFKAKSRRIGSYIRSCLKDDSDNTHRNCYLFNLQAVFEGSAVKNSAHGIGQSCNLSYPVSHTVDSLLRQSESVEK